MIPYMMTFKSDRNASETMGKAVPVSKSYDS